MEVDTFTVPSAQTVNGEGMAQVIGSRPDSAPVGLQPGQFEQNRKVRAAVSTGSRRWFVPTKKRAPHVRWRVLQASGEVSIEFS